MRHPKLTDSEISAHLTDLPGWSSSDDKLQRTYDFASADTATKFVDEVNAYANEMDHHPDIATSGNTVTVTLTTHDVGGITGLDFRLAQEVESAAADGHGHGKEGMGDTHTDPHTA